MKQKLLSSILSIFILIVISCEKNKSPTSCDEMKFPKQLTSSGLDFMSYWSPNGEHIAFLSARDTYNPNVAAIRCELWLMNCDDSDQHPLILINDLYEGSITVRSISWSKNSQEMLARIQPPRGRSEVWRVSVDGSKARLSSTDDWTGQPIHSPDGLRIAYTIQGPMPPDGNPFYYLYVSNPYFSEPVLVNTGLIQDFVWNSNSNGLIYTLYDWENVNFELWKSSITGNEKLQFSNTLVSEEDPCCSSDGRYIAYSVQNTVYITQSDAFQTKKVLDNARLPKWIPNSNLLLITSERTLDNESFWTESWIVDLEGEIIKKIAEGKPTSVNFSSDGEYFVYSLDGNLWVDQLLK